MIVRSRAVGMGVAAVCVAGAAMLAGCNPAAPLPMQKEDYTVTLNRYYEGRPMCLWQEPVKFPIESPTEETQDALGLDCAAGDA